MNLIKTAILGAGILAATLPSAAQVLIEPAPVLPSDTTVNEAVKAVGDKVPQIPKLPTALNGETVVLSRQECLAIALQENLTVKVADLEITRLDLSKKETRAALFPQIDFSGSYQRSIELQTMSMNMGGQSQSIKMGTDNNWNFGFTAAMPLVNAQLWKSLQISDTQILANYENARASRLNLIDQINKAYYTLLLAKASYEVLKDNYELAKYTADLYAKQFSLGTATEYDVLRSSVQVKNVEPELLQAEIAIDQARLQLRVLMGIADNIVIEPNVTLADMQADMYEYVAGLDRSLNDNSDLRSLDIQRTLAEQTVDLRKRAWIPTLGAQFNINWMAMSNGNAFAKQTFNPYSNVALALSVPIFSGGSKYYGVKQAEVQVKEIKLQRENLVNSLNMQVDLAIDNINREVKQIDTSAEGVRQAEKAHEIMQKSFEIGAGSYLNLRYSELAETSAKLSYYQAIYNYLISTSELDLLLGREDELRNIGYTFPVNKK